MSTRLRGQMLTLAHQLHATLLNSIGALLAQSQICENAVASGELRSLDEVARLRKMLKELEATARGLIESTFSQSHPDLADALSAEITEFRRKHPEIAVEAVIDGVFGIRARWLIRLVTDVVHEALANSSKHGRPSHVEVRTSLTQQGLLLRIRDNGQGFDVRQATEHGVAKAPGRYGILIMQETAKSVQGRFEISSAPGRGTQVTFFVPQVESRFSDVKNAGEATFRVRRRAELPQVRQQSKT
jgi:signal transduction histidine kinase